MAAQSCVGSVSGTASIKSDRDEERPDFNTKEVQYSNDSMPNLPLGRLTEDSLSVMANSMTNPAVRSHHSNSNKIYIQFYKISP